MRLNLYKRNGSAGGPRLVLALCLLLIVQAAAFAQGTRGSIAGTVTDPTGAVVPGANVTLVDTARNIEIRTIVSTDEGTYSFLEVEPANYEIRIKAANFADASLTDVKVEPNRNLRLDVTLSVAGSTEQVEVTAGDVLIDRETATLGTTVENRRIVGLPLNGRNVLSLALLQPGVAPAAAGFGQGVGIRVNGQRGVENNVTLDGANNNEVAVGGITGQTPRPDSVEEFRLLTSNYGAEFGRNSGSIINVVTRSGTNEFHGNGRFFYRPTFLSAARFFDKATASEDRAGEDLRRPFERKEFGGNIGGPVRIPYLYNGTDHTFFFFDYEGRRQLIGDTRTLTGLPTAAERMGDFSGLVGRTIRDPETGDPFPGNIIPQDRFSPIALFYLSFLPLPDSNGRAVVAANEITNNDQITTRVDHRYGDKQSYNFTFNYFDQTIDSPFAFGGASVPGFGSQDLRTTYNYVLRHTYIISPNIVNSFLAGYARNNFPGVAPQNKLTAADIGFTGNFVANPQFSGPPRVTLFDRGLILGNSIQGPQTRVTENFQIQDSVSWVHGDHTFKFGFDGTLYKQDQLFLFINQGIFTFSGRFGGNTTRDDLADLLIGNSPAALQLGANGERDFRQKNVSFFGQDTWRVRPDLTLTLGLRYEYTSPLTDKFNRVAYYRPGTTSQLLINGQVTSFDGVPLTVPAGNHAPDGLVYVGDPDPVLGGTVPDGGVGKDFNNFGPRLGIAWSPVAKEGSFLAKVLGNNETVIRTGFGVYFGAIVGDNILQQLNAPGFNGTNAFFSPGSGTLADPFLPDPFPDYGGNQGTLDNPFARSQFVIAAPLAQFTTPIDPNIRTPYTYQYNFTVERGFLTNYVASVSYVGNRGVKLYSSQQVNPSLGTFFPAPLDRVIPVPTAANANARRLNADVTVGLNQLVSLGNSWYNALEVNVQRRYANGLLFQLAYTYSKSINDSDTQRDGLDILRRDASKSLSESDIPNRFVGSWLYDLPFAKNTTGAWNRLLDGWGVGGIATFASGTPFSVGNLFDTTGTAGVISLADIGAAYQQTDPRSTDGRAFNVDAFKPFGDPADGFVLATDFRIGSSAVNQFRLNNGVNNWDFIISKKTRLWNESSNLELRFEFFNAFNHTQFTDVDLNLANVVLDDNGNPDPLKSSFGKYTAAAESRVIQLGVRLSF